MNKLKHMLFSGTAMLLMHGAMAQATMIHIHKAVDTTITGHISKINHDRLNGKMNMYPVFTHNFNPGGGAGKYQVHTMGLYYFNDQWKIYDEDKNAFIENTYYNVLIPGEGTSSWAHTATKDNIVNNYTLIDHPKFNGKPDVHLFVSHMYNPGGKGANYHKHQVGVFYQISEQKWAIYNEDQSAMDENAAFNIVFVSKSSDVERYTHTADGNNTSKHITILDHEDLNNKPDAKLVIQHLYNLNGGKGGKYNDHPVGVYYNGTRWAIYNENKEDMQIGLHFNVLIANDEVTASKKEEKMEIPSLRVGPNPIKQGETLNVGMFNEYNEAITLELVDVQGKVIYKRIVHTAFVVLEELSTVDLNKGLYFLKVRGTQVEAVRRVVIH